MPLELTWLGHACWLIQAGNTRLLVDPYLDDNPAGARKSHEVEADYILVTHGHFDHVTDAAEIAKRTGATVVANFEICQWLSQQGVENGEAMNTGGSIVLPFGRVKLTVAHHSSTLPDGTPGGNPNGFVVALPEANIYIAGDTALFGDMRLIGQATYNGRRGIDLAILPIGDRFTMGPEDSIEAVKLIEPKHVAPCHYNTWPPIEQDAQSWAEAVRSQTKAQPHTPEPGGTIAL